MANYYAITINSDKMTPKVAARLLERIGEHNLIQNFSFYDGYMFSYTRGCPDIADILTEENFTKEEVKIEDEFERFWTGLFEKYFADLPITKGYHSILEKSVNEEVVRLDWDGDNQSELEDFFQTCWGSRSFRFEPENEVIIGVATSKMV